MNTQTLQYKKAKSIIGLRGSNTSKLSAALEKIQAACKNEAWLNKLTSYQQDIVNQALNDLNSPGDSADFVLTPYIASDILSYSNSSIIPLYLFHRYRYDVFPEKKILDHFPPYLQIEPSSVCNYRCTFCYQANPELTKRSYGHMGKMSLETFKKVVDEAEGNVEFISLASRGEPLLNKDIEAMLAYTRGKFLNLKMNTNASRLTEEKAHAILKSGIKTLVFSADASKEPLYSQLRRGGKLDNVVKNIERFNKIKDTHYPQSEMITRVSGVKCREDQDLDEMEAFWGDLAQQVSFVQYNPIDNVYKQEENDIKSPCSELWRRMFIWWDGKVNPCENDYQSMLSVGNFNSNSLKELWQSDNFKKLRQNHLDQQRSQRFPCRRCTST